MDRQRVAALFEQAVDLPESERAAWVEAACGSDAALRIELERLLRADARAVAFMERPPPLVSSAIEVTMRGNEALPRFGPWRALRRIGAGGMGEVWLAERNDAEFEQQAAVKQLAWPTPGLLQRFRQERQILARLQHPDIARLIDGGVDEGGAPYLVMEYVDGVPITQYVRDHALDLRARLKLFLRICAAVQYAHQNLVVHRDLKPSNIMVGADGSLKLLDFGIAKVLATTDEAAQTQTAARLLTPDYAAPEQFSGGAITTATDVYALGVVLYELLADARPPRSTPTGNTKDTVGPPPPSAACDRTTGRAHRRTLRGDLDRITLAALAPEPRHRYPSAEALSTDVQRFLDGQPISARRDSRWYRFRKFARRNRYALAAAVFVCAVCVLAAAISLRQANLARAQARHAAAVQQFMSGVFAQANPDENKGQPISAQQLLEKGEEQLARMNGAQPALQTDVTAMLGGLYSDLGETRRAEALLKAALAGVNDATPDDVRGRVLVRVATLEAENKDTYDDALAHARDGISALERAAEKDWEEIAIGNRIIALCHVRRREPEAAIALLQEVTPVHAAMMGGRPSEALANEYVVLGAALGDMARFDQAEAALERGTTMLRAVAGDGSRRVAYALNEEANVLYQKGDLDRAEARHREVASINRKLLGPDNISTITATANLLGDIEGQGRVAEALPQRLALLDLALASDALSPVRKAHHYDAVAIDYRELGRFAESEAMTRKALALLDAAQGARSRSSVTIMRHLGVVLAFEGRYADAEAVFRDALAIQLEGATSTSLSACGLRRDIGAVLAQQHHFAEAIEQLQALTADACMVGLSDSDAWRPQALADLSQAQLDNGDTAAAYATAQQALTAGRKALANSHLLAVPLFAHARVSLALEHAAEAEVLLREALALRSPVHPADDPRILEIRVELVNALRAQKKNAEASVQIAEIEPLLEPSRSPYAAELRARLAAR
ncbi:MAG TPA: serine/threonine-protein kinase [Rhodanobacteraceae bacterium]|nr:serine/threonine-protein kinase [Rhodanobacteraceae bacterium]